MEGTCSKDCPLWKKYKGSCPNYMESWWTPEDGKKPILVNDCAPKRTFIMIQELHNRFIGVEKSQEEQRNKINDFFGLIQLGLTRHERLK